LLEISFVMDNTLNINQIVGEIEKLDYNDKINILSRIANLRLRHFIKLFFYTIRINPDIILQ
jgi:hypothetical protein